MNSRRAAHALFALSSGLSLLAGCSPAKDDSPPPRLANAPKSALAAPNVPMQGAAEQGAISAETAIPADAAKVQASSSSADVGAAVEKAASNDSPGAQRISAQGMAAPPGMMAGGMPAPMSQSEAQFQQRMRYANTDSHSAARPALPASPEQLKSMPRAAAARAFVEGSFGGKAVREQQSAIQNPNLYVADTYIGGNGEKDRLEKLIQSGVLVDGKRVKLEAFTHNYAQAFPIPQQTALSVSAEGVQSKIIQSGAHTYLQVGLQAMKGELPRRPPLNIALVIDRSGSMAAEHKLEYAKSAAVQLVNSLTDEDTFALVAFDDRATLLVPSQRARDKARIRGLIGSLHPGGGTNIYAGLSQAYQQVHRNAIGDGINRVILLSDGVVTSGVQDRAQFHRLAAGEVDKDVQTSAVGVGVEFNEDLMLSLARDGKGNYHFLKDGADTQQVFARELDELTHVVAKNVKLRIQLAPGVGLVRVMGAPTLDARETALVKQEEKKIDRKVSEELGIAPDRQNDKDEPGIKMLIPAFYRGDSHVVMLEITAPPENSASALAWAASKHIPTNPSNTCLLADVTVKYKDLVHPANREARATAAVAYTPSKDEMIYSVNRNVKKNLLGFQTGEALTQAAQCLEQGRVGDAIQKVQERETIVRTAAQMWQDDDLNRDGKLLDRYKSVLAQLSAHRQLAQGDMGQYLRRSLAYNGYKMTR